MIAAEPWLLPYLNKPSIGYAVKKIDELFGFYQASVRHGKAARDKRKERDGRDSKF
jgi:hypothetical protein